MLLSRTMMDVVVFDFFVANFFSYMDCRSLFTGWIEDAAIEATKKGGKMAIFYNRALDSIRRFKEPITDPKTLRLIPYIGSKTVQTLTKKLEKHCNDEGIPFPDSFKQAPEQTRVKKVQTTRRKRQYIPKHRSGGFAILIALYIGDIKRVGLLREEIVKIASPYSEKSFSFNPGADFYSAWSSIKVLINNELVDFSGRSPKVYFLTDEGVELAEKLALSVNLTRDDADQIIDESFDNNVRLSSELSHEGSPQKGPSIESTQHDVENRIYNGTRYDIWTPEEYEIWLIIDNREVRSLLERNFFETRLNALSVPCETRALTVGDALWIAKNVNTGKEVVLDYICERKRFSDLVMSIKDGRFQEQKHRLKKTGMSHYYYIIEENGIDGEMMNAVKTSLAATMTTSEFYLRKHKDIDETILFLASVTEIIKETLTGTKLIVLRPKVMHTQSEYTMLLEGFKFKLERKDYKCVHLFAVFQQLMAKTGMMTVKEAFILMLMSIKGVSLERAITIQQRFKTPRKLIEFYSIEHRGLGVKEKRELMMKEFKDNVGSKKIGKNVLEMLFEVWGER